VESALLEAEAQKEWCRDLPVDLRRTLGCHVEAFVLLQLPARARPRGDLWYEGKESTRNGDRRGGAGDVQAMGKLRE
jgi:hypothetical protein